MTKNRLEAFSDGVLAIIITIMVLELKAPHGAELSDLTSLAPIFFSYVLSFIYIGIYWNNHHHLLHAAQKVNGGILLANLHLLFWLSLLPFGTAWMAETHFEPVPVAIYGALLLLAGVAYFILSQILITHHGKDSLLAKAVGKDFKGKISLFVYIIAIIAACYTPILAQTLYALVAVMWLLPDRRIERVILK